MGSHSGPPACPTVWLQPCTAHTCASVQLFLPAAPAIHTGPTVGTAGGPRQRATRARLAEGESAASYRQKQSQPRNSFDIPGETGAALGTSPQ